MQLPRWMVKIIDPVTGHLDIARELLDGRTGLGSREEGDRARAC